MLVCTTQVKSAFGARWLASSEVISRAKLEKSIIFLLIVPHRVVFGAIYSTCVVYTGE